MRISHVFASGGLLVAALLAGCSTVHQVTVDAISDRSRALGVSYHLDVDDPTGGVEPGVHAVAISNIKDALGARGLYEVPASVRPDMVIEASYGVGHGHVSIVTERNSDLLTGGLIPPPNSKAVVVFDKTLELTAHAPESPNAPGGKARSRDELWSIKTKITDTKQDISAYLPALASACIDYIGENPGREVILPVDTAQAKVLLQKRPAAAEPAAK